MVTHSDGLHHLEIRKRIHEKHEEYPHPDKKKALLDKIVYAIAILGPIFTIPQVLQVFITKSAEGVSLLTFGSYVIISGIWVIYGVVHKEKPILLSHTLFGLLFLAIFIGGIIYR